MMAQTEWVPENGADREWLGKQLAQWPTRVDEERTTNVTFLMSAAATELTRLQSAVEALRVAVDTAISRLDTNVLGPDDWQEALSVLQRARSALTGAG